MSPADWVVLIVCGTVGPLALLADYLKRPNESTEMMLYRIRRQLQAILTKWQIRRDGQRFRRELEDEFRVR